jgi:glycosyltransferase involved in cell wall biosynthesis
VPPHVSVIVPVRDRRALLRDLLGALAAQSYRDFEVVLVDDGSTDGSGDEAKGLVLGAGEVVVVETGGVGAVGARCAGVAAAAGRVLAFTDSDCRPRPHWLERGVAAIDAGADLVAGLTRPPRELLPLERSMSSGEEGLYPTCNLFVRRETFERNGGFDRAAAARLGFRWSGRAKGLGFGEDTILAWRIRRSGSTCRFEPDAVVEHHIFPARLSELPGRAVQGGAFPALIREVPELRSTLLKNGFLLGSARRAPFYATLVALASRHPRVAVVTAGWWFGTRSLGLRGVPVPRSRKLQLVLAEIAMDALLGSMLTLGSVRARTLVL